MSELVHPAICRAEKPTFFVIASDPPI